jgi:hypothetical protein
MKVRLLQNVVENGGVKIVRRRKQADGTYAIEVPFVKGAVIEMSDASGQKYIDAGAAERVADDTEVQS